MASDNTGPTDGQFAARLLRRHLEPLARRGGRPAELLDQVDQLEAAGDEAALLALVGRGVVELEREYPTNALQAWTPR